MEHATPNLPSRDFDATQRFYEALGFTLGWRDHGWMILRRGGLQLEFFPYPDLDPATSSFGCCLRLEDAQAFCAEAIAAGVPESAHGQPRVHAPRREAWGGLVGGLIDPDGTLLRIVEEPR